MTNCGSSARFFFVDFHLFCEEKKLYNNMLQFFGAIRGFIIIRQKPQVQNFTESTMKMAIGIAELFSLNYEENFYEEIV